MLALLGAAQAFVCAAAFEMGHEAWCSSVLLLELRTMACGSRGMAAAKHVDIDILVGGGVCRDDDATLEKLGVTFEGGRAVQSRDVFANLPHLVS